jgi:hypothetical protein
MILTNAQQPCAPRLLHFGENVPIFPQNAGKKGVQWPMDISVME